MQFSPNESFGRTQVVKSALMSWNWSEERGRQALLFRMMDSSLSANWAWETVDPNKVKVSVS